MRLLSLFLTVSVVCKCAAGDPPTLTQMFPPGAARGTTTEVTAKGKLGDGELRFWSNRPDVQWEKSEKENAFQVTIAEDAAPGFAYVRIWNDDGVSDVLPFAIGHIQETLEVEPNDDLSTAAQVNSDPILINGLLEKRADVDHFTISVAPGETLIASIQAVGELKSEADTTLQIVDMRGNVLAQNLDYHGLDPQIVWTAPKSDTPSDRLEVVVRVFGFPVAPNSTIALAGGEKYVYRLTITKGPWCEGVLPLAVSSLEPTTLVPMGWNLPADLQVSAPPQPATDDTYNTRATAQKYAFVMPGIPNAYSLPVESIVPIVNPSVATSASPIDVSLPAIVCGNICFIKQHDMIEFDAIAGTKWTLEVESRSLGYPLDAVVTITDAATGKELSRTDDNSKDPDPRVQWTVPTDGRYRVTIADINGDAYENNLYRLSIFQEQPSFHATVSAASFTGKVNEPLEIAIKVQRQSGFDQPIEFALESAIEGVEAKPVVSDPKGDTAKELKLVLTSSISQVAPIRIKAKVADQQKSAISVTDATDGIADLWIIVKP